MKIRHWAHIVLALVAGFSVVFHIYAPIPLIVLYITYQVIQDWRYRTKSSLDIREFAVFFTPTYITCLILSPVIKRTIMSLILKVLG